jgi:hypothetical protein
MKRTPLKRKTPLKRSGSLAAVSKKRAKLNRARAVFVADELSKRQTCEANIPDVCTRRATELHEPILRSFGGSILDVENSVAICRLCHTWVHDNVGEARELGLIKSAPPYNGGRYGES